MPNTIHVLSEATINQIAAGEVIENPASVVKELVENSIDADATRITVTIERGGFQKISVSDNGKGMGREDLLLCLERHATSKIRIADDLVSILSMGFRGEALASIAAISRLTLISSQRGEAHELHAEGGRIKSLEASARNQGTTIEVCSLFYNVPARKKFQKSSLSSQNEIVKMLTKLALAHPLLELKCIADGKEVISSFMHRSKKRDQVTQQVIEKVLGEKFLAGASQVSFQESGCKVEGFVGPAYQTRKNRAGQYLFVNGRAVQSPEIARAIYEGYGSRLPSNEHPTFVLHLTLPTEWIDVNVHPQKKEIRLLEARQIEQVIRRGVLEAFQEKVASPVKQATFETPINWTEQVQPVFQFREEEENKPPELPMIELPVIGLYSHYLLLDSSRLELSISGPEGIVLVDLQLAEACITFEAVMNRFEKGGEMQTLLFPLTFECGSHEQGQVSLHLETLQQLGIAIRPFGETAFVVDAIDPCLEEDKIESLVFELVQILERFEDPKHLEKEQQKKLALSVLRFARSQKEGYTMEQARALTKELFEMPSQCHAPNGKPTCVYLSQDEIEKHFR